MKKKVLWLILDAVFLVFFNACFFMGGLEHKASAWISYLFIHFAYLMLLATPYLIKGGESAAVFGFALYAISGNYFIFEAILGIVFILISPEGYRAALIIQGFFAAIYIALLVSNLLANEHTAEKEEKRRTEIDYVKKAVLELSLIMNGVSDAGLRKKVERAFDALKSSPSKSHPDVARIESNMLTSIEELREVLKTDDENYIVSRINALLSLISERNSRLKALN